MFATVMTCQTQEEADLAISLLESAGLHPIDLEVSPHISLAGAETGFRVEVPKEELEAARELLG
jgi:hypothetical protein